MDRTEEFEADLAAGARRALEQGRDAGDGEDWFEADLVAGVREQLRRREEARRRREEWVQKRWDEFFQRLAEDAMRMDD